MALQATFRPIDKWPGNRTASYQRKRSTFKASYSDTLSLLEDELVKIGGKQVVIRAGFEPKDIRNDRWPRSSARPKSDPGVIVSCQSKQGALSFPCDRFDAWEDNLRAIAKSLEALRMVDRYGVTRGNEQYKGFAQLPPAPTSEKKMATSEAADFIARHSTFSAIRIGSDLGIFREAYRQAARKLHPDTGSGSHESFVQLSQAEAVLNGVFNQ
jgi:hypothetical protein